MFDLITLFFYFVLVVLAIIPSWRILRRIGLSPWWSLFSFVPIGTICDLVDHRVPQMA